jgi:hypothetical protein
VKIAVLIFAVFVCPPCALGQVSIQDAPSRAAPTVRIPNAPPMQDVAPRGQAAPMGGFTAEGPNWTREQCERFLARAERIPDLKIRPAYNNCVLQFPGISLAPSITGPEAPPKN